MALHSMGPEAKNKKNFMTVRGKNQKVFTPE